MEKDRNIPILPCRNSFARTGMKLIIESIDNIKTKMTKFKKGLTSKEVLNIKKSY